MTRSGAIFSLLLFLTASCSIDTAGVGSDQNLDDGAPPVDSAPSDSGAVVVDSTRIDTTVDEDAGLDTAPPIDSSPIDSTTTIDSTPLDSGVDSAPVDSGVDTKPIDSGVDTAPVDSGVDTTPPDTAIACGEAGAIRYGGHCYFSLAPGRTWDEARLACAGTSPAAHLASITSSGEQAAVGALLGTAEAWIGLSRATAAPSVKASFTWITGELQIYDGWDGGEPDNSGACARIRPGPSWADSGCNTPFRALCERE